MRITIDVSECGRVETLTLGRKGENEVTEIEFDTSAWAEEYGEGTLELSVQPNGRDEPYLAALDGNVWTLTQADLQYVGLGEMMLSYYVGTKIKESAIWSFMIERRLDGNGETPPDPFISWFERMEQIGAQATQDAASAAQSKMDAEQAAEDAETAAQDARASADEIENMTATAETLPAGSDATAEYSDGTLSLGIPQGVPGDEGPQGPPGPTGNGIQSAVLNADYTLTITFTNGEHYTTPSIRGPQGPDGETGPTGKGIKSTVLNSDYTLTITFTDDTTYTTPSIRGEQGEQGEPGVVQDVTVNGTSVLDGAVAKVVIPEITKTVTGNPIVIDDADGEVKALNVELTPIQAGTGTPSPTNIRPIYPHTSLPVRDTGINQWDEEWELGGLNGSTGALWNTTDRIRSKNYVKVLPNTSYYIHFPTSGVAMDYCFYDADKTFISSGNNVNSIITAPTNAHYMKFATYAQYGTTYNNDISINYPSTDHDYHPYTGQTVTVPLNDLYGGLVDVIKGQDGKETIQCDTFNGDSITQIGEQSGVPFARVVASELLATGTPLSGFYCNSYTMANTGASGTIMWVSNNQQVVRIFDERFTDLATATAILNASPVQLAYPKRTPTPITTTPTPLTLYKGDNVISSDGDMELTYVRNLQAVIDKIEAAL